MTLESDLQATLEADATLTGLLTGGIYTREELGKMGLHQDNAVCVSAWMRINDLDTLQPCLVIRQRSETPTDARVDNNTQVVSVARVVEMYFYDASSFTTITTARDRVYQLLHAQGLSGVGRFALMGRLINLYDESVYDAALLRDEYITQNTIGG